MRANENIPIAALTCVVIRTRSHIFLLAVPCALRCIALHHVNHNVVYLTEITFEVTHLDLCSTILSDFGFYLELKIEICLEVEYHNTTAVDFDMQLNNVRSKRTNRGRTSCASLSKH